MISKNPSYKHLFFKIFQVFGMFAPICLYLNVYENQFHFRFSNNIYIHGQAGSRNRDIRICIRDLSTPVFMTFCTQLCWMDSGAVLLNVDILQEYL